MVALNLINLPISEQAPLQGLREEEYVVINELYVQLKNLTKLLNASGLVMQSPNGHFWVASISDAGVLTWTDVGTVRP